MTALTSRDAALKAEFVQLRMDVALASEVLPLLDATEGSGLKMPGYGRERLQTKVRQTLGAPKRETDRSGMWRWWLGVATAAGVVVLVVIKLASPGLPPVIQVGSLDSVGGTRGTGQKPLAVLQRQWKESTPQEFSDNAKLKVWQEDWSPGAKQTVVKVVYDRDPQEVRLAEAGFQSAPPLGRTYGLKGTTPVVKSSGQRQHRKVISAVQAHGSFWAATYPGKLNAEACVEFLRDFMQGRRKVFLVVDGHPAHKANRVKTYLATLPGRLELHFLPPYAPDLNPHELVWH